MDLCPLFYVQGIANNSRDFPMIFDIAYKEILNRMTSSSLIIEIFLCICNYYIEGENRKKKLHSLLRFILDKIVFTMELYLVHKT